MERLSNVGATKQDLLIDNLKLKDENVTLEQLLELSMASTEHYRGDHHTVQIHESGYHSQTTKSSCLPRRSQLSQQKINRGPVYTNVDCGYGNLTLKQGIESKIPVPYWEYIWDISEGNVQDQIVREYLRKTLIDNEVLRTLIQTQSDEIQAFEITLRKKDKVIKEANAVGGKKSKIADLEYNVLQLRKENNTLLSSQRELKTQVQNLKYSLTERDDKIKDVTKQHNDYKVSVARELADLQEKVRQKDMEIKNETQKQELEILKIKIKENKRHNTDIEGMRHERDSRHGSLLQLETDNKTLLRTKNELENEVQNLKKKFDEMEENFRRHKQQADKELIDIQENARQSDVENRKLRDKNETLEQEQEELKRKIKENDRQKTDIGRLNHDHERLLTETNRTYELKIQELESNVASLRHANAEGKLKSNLDGDSEKISKMQAELKSLSDVNHNLQQTNFELENEVRWMENKVKDLERTNESQCWSAQQKIQALEKTIEQNNQIIKVLKNKEDKAKDMDTVQRRFHDEESRLLQLQAQAKDEIAKLASDLEKEKSAKDREWNTKMESERKAQELERKLRDLQTSTDATLASKNETIKRLEQQIIVMKETNKKLERVHMPNVGGRLSSQEIQNAQRERDERIAELNERLQQALAKLKETEAELDDTKTRLSKTMGDKLTDNNPNITDLSDMNRPVKLAERFSELYDNQWTDAFDILQKYYDNEESVIDILLQIIQCAMRFCVEEGSKQMETLKKTLGFSNRPVDFPDVANKQLKDCRKVTHSIALYNLHEMFKANLKRTTLKTLKKAFEVEPYVKECLDLCWLMVIQDPPVVLAPVAQYGNPLDTDLYRPYTSSGTRVEFTVWPALLLHDGGPVLAKGVAQGCGRKSGK